LDSGLGSHTGASDLALVLDLDLASDTSAGAACMPVICMAVGAAPRLSARAPAGPEVGALPAPVAQWPAADLPAPEEE
jgi:hypothetical protein